MSFVGAPPVTRTAPRPGYAGIEVAADGETTRLVDLAQSVPLRLLFPRVPESEPLTACLVNTAGGMVGGDAHDVRAKAGAGARLLLMAQAAEKIYRSTGAISRIDIALAAESESWLEYLPQETILFDRARFARRTRIDLAAGARLLAGEILVFGRTAHGERVAEGFVRDAIEVARDGRLIWTDALHVDGDLARPLNHPAAFDGMQATALLVLHAPDAEGHRDALRNCAAPDGVQFGATLVGGLVIARWLAADALAMRRHYASAWTLLRNRAGGLAPRLPPIWHV